jgi:four helix bundle protein
MPGFKQLNVWQLSKKLAVEIYKLTQGDRFSRDFGLCDQIRRAAVSIPSNVAEGDERGTNKDAIRFFYIAKGSLAELQTQLEIAHEIGYIDRTALDAFNEDCTQLAKMLGSLIKARSAVRTP